MTLTEREREVLIWATAGKTNAEIAAVLGVDSDSVDADFENIFKVFGVKTRVMKRRLRINVLKRRTSSMSMPIFIRYLEILFFNNSLANCGFAESLARITSTKSRVLFLPGMVLHLPFAGASIDTSS